MPSKQISTPPPSKPSSKLSAEQWANVSRQVGEHFRLEKSVKEQRAEQRQPPHREPSLDDSTKTEIPLEAQPTDANLKPEGRPAETLCGGIRPAYGSDVLPGETEKQYQERKEREASEQHTYSATGMLTPSEIERLQRVASELSASAKRAFAHLRPTVNPNSQRLSPEERAQILDEVRANLAADSAARTAAQRRNKPDPSA
jgi:hypothetical protein